MNIEIAMAINRAFLQHFYVVLESINSTRNNKNKFILYILHNDLLIEDIDLLFSKYGNEFVLNFYNMKDNILNSLSTNAHISAETYYRIILPEIVPVSSNKVIYLDSDIVLCDDLENLWEINMENYSLAAVYDYKGQYRKSALNMPESSFYFNAGILVFNLEKWREKGLSKSILSYIKQNEYNLKYMDQDALNAILFNDVKFIDPRWNLQTAIFEHHDEGLKEIKSNPKIVHFTGASKPWHISSDNPYKSLYFYHLKNTPYKDYDIVNNSTKNLILNKENIFIWGAGPTGKSVKNYLNIPIKGFIDSDETKWGDFVDGICIFSIDAVPRDSSVGIIVSSGHYREIKNKLEKYNYIEGIDFVHQM